jgi:hypothetical protein
MKKKFVLGLCIVTISLFYPTQGKTWSWSIWKRHGDKSIDEYHRTLRMHEGYISKNGDNGHTLRKHVYVNYDYLRDRCRREKISYASKFISYHSASETARNIIEDNAAGIAEFQYLNSIGMPRTTTYSIAGPHDYVRGVYWWQYWQKNAINCDPNILGTKYPNIWWHRFTRRAGKYRDKVKLYHARMVIKFNNARDKKRWFISTEYPVKW